MGPDAFKGCTGLTEVTASGMASIADLFTGCEKLATINVVEGSTY